MVFPKSISLTTLTAITIEKNPRLDFATKVEYFTKMVCDYYQISVLEYNSGLKIKPIPEARSVVRYCLRELFPNVSYRQIGVVTNNCDHSTAMYSVKLIRDLLDAKDKAVTEIVSKIIENR